MPHHYESLIAKISSQAMPAGMEGGLSEPLAGLGKGAGKGISALFWGLLLIVAVPVAILAGAKIVRYMRVRKQKELIEQMKQEARRHEKAGEFASAGLLYEKLKDLLKAAGLFELAGDFRRAALIYESLGEMKKTKEMYEKAGDPEKAAEICIIAGDYAEAARIYRQCGDKLKTAQALEMTGNRLAAVRAYREANDYQKAAHLLKEEGMHKEAAEMYAISLVGEEMERANFDRFYYYASLLETAGEVDKACEIYRDIATVNPDYRDAAEKAGRLSNQGKKEELEEAEKAIGKDEAPAASSAAPSETPGPEEPRGINLRKLLAHRMEPRYSLRLWVQILKALDREVTKGVSVDDLTPENIFIDSANTVTFSFSASGNVSYRSPEAASVSPADEASLIYSMGIILYEMIAGTLGSFGLKRLGEVRDDIPQWLDELTMKCTERERAERYRSFDQIFSTLLSLKNRT
jgi:tetratricopeptide (TPR) repeat protein